MSGHCDLSRVLLLGIEDLLYYGLKTREERLLIPRTTVVTYIALRNAVIHLLAGNTTDYHIRFVR